MGFLWDVRCLMTLGHPHSHRPSWLILVPFAQSAGTCPLYRHTVWALSLLFPSLISSDMG